MRIPNRLNFVWLGAPKPQWVAANIDRWRELNPEYTVTIYNEAALLPELEDCYRRSEDFCTRSDIIRLSVLRKNPGWYFDTDFVPLKPMRTLADTYNLSCGCFLTKQWENGPKRIANGVIGIAKDSPVWEEIDTAIAQSRLEPIERCTYGPLLATRLVQRCREIEIGRTNDFYLWRFSASDEAGVNIAMRKYETLLEGNFDEASMEATCGGERPPVVHLWMGGKYATWQPCRVKLSAPGLDARKGVGGACSACNGAGSSVGCTACKGSGMACDQTAPISAAPRGELEAWADAYGMRVSCFDPAKIMLVPK